jgi:5-methyltetrahydrofolate--homocysteine methyltransferase
MKTRVSSPKGKEVLIGDGLPSVLIGERIHPFGRGPIKDAMKGGNMESICLEAQRQVEAGADILMISVAAFGLDEEAVLPQVTAAVLKTVDIPLCLESRHPLALEKTLQLGLGKPIISSVSGEETVLSQVLPLVEKYKTAVVVLASDETGIPKEPFRRVNLIEGILNRTGSLGIDPEDILVDCVAESAAVNDQGVRVTLETMGKVKQTWGGNLVLGASNVSFGLPQRIVLNAVFLSLAVQAGLNVAIVDPARMKPYLLAADLLLGRDPRARRYTAYYRKLKSASAH